MDTSLPRDPLMRKIFAIDINVNLYVLIKQSFDCMCFLWPYDSKAVELRHIQSVSLVTNSKL